MPTRVLIVDDHDAFRVRVRRLLEAEGYDVVGEAADGEAALTEARRLSPDLVLLDLHLRDRSGFAVAGELADSGCRPAVVITSTRDAADFGPMARRYGACGFVTKAEIAAATLEPLIAEHAAPSR